MKRVLSWLVLIAGYVIFIMILVLDMMLFQYLMGLYDELSAFLKLMVWIIGGTFLFGLLVAPLWYGIPLVHHFSELVCESRKGLRYTVFGIYICAAMVLAMFREFGIEQIFEVIFGIAMIVIGHRTRKDANAKQMERR